MPKLLANMMHKRAEQQKQSFKRFFAVFCFFKSANKLTQLYQSKIVLELFQIFLNKNYCPVQFVEKFQIIPAEFFSSKGNQLAYNAASIFYSIFSPLSIPVGRDRKHKEKSCRVNSVFFRNLIRGHNIHAALAHDKPVFVEHSLIEQFW